MRLAGCGAAPDAAAVSFLIASMVANRSAPLSGSAGRVHPTSVGRRSFSVVVSEKNEATGGLFVVSCKAKQRGLRNYNRRQALRLPKRYSTTVLFAVRVVLFPRTMRYAADSPTLNCSPIFVKPKLGFVVFDVFTRASLALAACCTSIVSCQLERVSLKMVSLKAMLSPNAASCRLSEPSCSSKLCRPRWSRLNEFVTLPVGLVRTAALCKSVPNSGGMFNAVSRALAVVFSSISCPLRGKKPWFAKAFNIGQGPRMSPGPAGANWLGA